jgi:hypothetical protein
MTPIEKAKWLAEFYGAVAAGKTAQIYSSKTQSWVDVQTDYLDGPNIAADWKPWRIKPEQPRRWQIDRGMMIETTNSKQQADKWKEEGLEVSEWVKVI